MANFWADEDLCTAFLSEASNFHYRSLGFFIGPQFRVNVIAPSLTDSPLAQKLLNTDEKKEKMAARHPMKKVGTVEDIAATATYLLGSDSQWITGQVFGVDGGLSTINIS